MKRQFAKTRDFILGMFVLLNLFITMGYSTTGVVYNNKHISISKYYKMDNPREAAKALKIFLEENGIDVSNKVNNHPGKQSRKNDKVPEWQIHVPTGKEFIPEKGISPELLFSIKKMTSDTQMMCLLQFEPDLTYKDIINILEMDVKLFELISNRTYLVRLPVHSIYWLENQPYLRWIGKYSSSYKYDSDQVIKNYALVYSLIGNTQKTRKELSQKGVSIISYNKTLQCYEVTNVSRNVLEEISRLWWIKKIKIPSDVANLSMDAVSVNFEPNDSRELVMAYDTPYSGTNETIGILETKGLYSDHPELTNTFVNGSEFGVDSLHGTHVTGIIAGREKSIASFWGQTDVKGILPECNILYRNMETGSYPEDFDVFKDNNIQIINNSWRFEGDNKYIYDNNCENFDRYCDQDDMVLIVAAGNEHNNIESITNPSLAKNTISVGSISYVTSDDYYGDDNINPAGGRYLIGNVAAHSSFGPTRDDKRLKPDIVAPGGDGSYFWAGVVSTNAPNWDIGAYQGTINSDYEYPEWQSDDYYIRLSGTSMATPHVTGIAGKIKQWEPSVRSEEIKALLINTAIPIRDNSSNPLYGYANTKVGYGMVNGYLVTNDIPGETERLLSLTDRVTEDNRTYTNTVDIPSNTKYFAVTMAYNDLAGETSDAWALKNNLDLKLIAPSGQEYVFWANKPSNIETDSPIEKMVIDEDYMESGTWTVQIDFSDSPYFSENDPLDEEFAEEYFSLFLHAFYARPELEVSATSSKDKLGTEEEFTISTQITNTGGNIAAGVTVAVMEEGKNKDQTSLSYSSQSPAYKYRYVGNLIGQNSQVNPEITLTAPSTPGDYSLEVEVDAINKELQNNLYPKHIIIPIHVYSNSLTIDQYLDKSTYYPNESGVYTVILTDENGNPASGYSVEYIVETEGGSEVKTGNCPETTTEGTYESTDFFAPTDVGNYTIHANISYDGSSVTQSDKINFTVIEKGENTLSLVANPNPCDKYSTTVLTATYMDVEGNPLEGEQIEFTSYIDGTMEGGDIAPNIATTNSEGKASVNFTPEGEGGNIKANSVSNPSIEDIIELQVSSGELRVEIQVKAEDIGETISYYDLDIRAYNQDDELVTDATINSVTTTLGTVDSYTPTTGGYGIGDADISTTESGEAIITVDVEGSIGQTSTYFQVGVSDELEPVIEIIPTDMLEVHGIDWSSDDQRFLIAMKDNSNQGGRIDIYDTNNWEFINSIPSNKGETYGAAFSPDVSKVVGAHNGVFTTHNINDGSIITTKSDPDGNDQSRFTFWNNSDKVISICSKDGYDKSVALVLRGSDLSVLHVLTDGTSTPDQMDYCQETDKISVADGDFVYCYNGSTYNLEKTFELLDVSACFNGSGSRIAISRDNDYIRIYNYSTSSALTDITGSWSDEFADIDWSHDNEYIAGYNKDREVYIFDYDPSNDSGYELYKMSIGGASDGTLKWDYSNNLLGVENEEKVLIYSPTDVTDPQLSIEYPIDTLYTYDSLITTSGNTTDENGIKLLKINTPDQTYEITDLSDGDFSQEIKVLEGENIINYISYDNNWNSTQTERVIIRNADNSGPVISEVSITQEEIEINETALLKAKIIDDVSGILTGSTKAIMHNLDSSVVYTIILYDDGTHGDEAANDNYYSCTVSPLELGLTILDETYYFDIKAKDNSSSQNETYKDNATNAFIYDKPVISNIAILPETPTSNDSITIKCQITDYSNINDAKFYLKQIEEDNYIPYDLFNVANTDTFKNTITPQNAGQYLYYIKAVDAYGYYNFSDTLSLTVDSASPIGSEISLDIPKKYYLHQSYPNPFNPTTTIRYDLPISSDVKIDVFNSLGQKIKTLIQKKLPAGHHSVNFNGSALASGVYYYKITAGKFTQVKKMLLIK
ncbi:MAG TPA: T9SS type A sorting domain-containing protein [Gammaproteobacteria bacterium]|nr:T9SS type A sorting domain-containing protein [Gammaproteobacteria bacterium]